MKTKLKLALLVSAFCFPLSAFSQWGGISNVVITAPGEPAPSAFNKINNNFWWLYTNGLYNSSAVVSNSYNSFNLSVSNSLILTRSWYVLNYIDWTNNLAWPTNLSNSCTNTQGPFYQAYVTNSAIAYTNLCGFTMLFDTSTNFHLQGWNVPTNQIYAITISNTIGGCPNADGLYIKSGFNLDTNYSGESYTNVNGLSNWVQIASTNFSARWLTNGSVDNYVIDAASAPDDGTAYCGAASFCGSGPSYNCFRFYYGTSNTTYNNLLIPSLPFAFIPPAPTNAPSTNPAPQFSVVPGCGEYLTFRKGTTNLYLMGAQNIMAGASYVRVRLSVTNAHSQIGLFGPDRDGTVIVTRYGVASQTITWGDTNYWRAYPPSPPCGTP